MNGEGGSNFCIHYLNVWLWIKNLCCLLRDMWKLADKKERLPAPRTSCVNSSGLLKVPIFPSFAPPPPKPQQRFALPRQDSRPNAYLHLPSLAAVWAKVKAGHGSGQSAGRGSVLQALPEAGKRDRWQANSRGEQHLQTLELGLLW